MIANVLKMWETYSAIRKCQGKLFQTGDQVRLFNIRGSQTGIKNQKRKYQLKKSMSEKRIFIQNRNMLEKKRFMAENILYEGNGAFGLFQPVDLELSRPWEEFTNWILEKNKNYLMQELPGIGYT